MDTAIVKPYKTINFVLPKSDSDNLKVFRYLTKARGLPGDLVNDLICRGMIFQDSRGNCVFPCYNDDEEPRGAIIKSILSVGRKSNQRHRNSDISFGWALKPTVKSNLVLVTDCPVDALSIITLNPDLPFREKYILSLGGLSIEALANFLFKHPHVRKIVIGLNYKASTKIIDQLKKEFGSHKIARLCPPDSKSWNEYLLKKL